MINSGLYKAILGMPSGVSLARSALGWRAAQTGQAVPPIAQTLGSPGALLTQGDNIAIQVALKAVASQGPQLLKSQFERLFSQVQRFADLPAGPTLLRPTSQHFSFVPQIGATRIFSIPMGRDNGAFAYRVALIFPNWSRLEFEVLSMGMNGGSELTVRAPKAIGPSGKILGEISATPNPNTKNQILFSAGSTFLVLSLMEELRRSEVAHAPRRVLVHPGGILRLGDHPLFIEMPTLHDTPITLLGMGAMRTAPNRFGSVRHAVEFLFSDGTMASLKFLSSHHTGSDLTDIQGRFLILTSEGDQDIPVHIRTTWSKQTQEGKITLEAPDRIMEIPLGYPKKGSGDIRLGTPEVRITDTSWHLLMYPPHSSPLWFAGSLPDDVVEPVAETAAATSQTEETPSVATVLNKILQAGNIDKVHGNLFFSAKALYTGGKGSPWRVEAKFGKGSGKNKVVEAAFQFPGEGGTFKLVNVEGGTLLFSADESRYAGTSFFIPEARKNILLEVTSSEMRMRAAAGEAGTSDFKEAKTEATAEFFQREVAPLLREYRTLALRGEESKPKPVAAPRVIKTDKFFASLKDDPEMVLVASFDDRKRGPRKLIPHNHECEEHGTHRQMLHLYRVFGITEIQVFIDLSLPEAQPFGYYRHGNKFHPLVAVRTTEGTYIYLMGKLFGIAFHLDEKTMEMHEATSKLVRQRLLGENPPTSWEVSPAILERGLKALMFQRELDRLFRDERKGVGKDADRYSEVIDFGDEESFTMAKWQAAGSGPSVAWVGHLPEAMHPHLGIDIATHDFHDLLERSLVSLLDLERLQNLLMNLSDENTHNVELGMRLFSHLLSRVLDDLLIGGRTHLLQGRLNLLRQEGAEIDADRLSPFIARLKIYLRQTLLESLSDALPSEWKDKLVAPEFLERVPTPSLDETEVFDWAASQKEQEEIDRLLSTLEQ